MMSVRWEDNKQNSHKGYLKQGRLSLLSFPCCTLFGGLQYTLAWFKNPGEGRQQNLAHKLVSLSRKDEESF